MMTKFIQELYAKMKARKNEPLSILGKKVVWVVEKGTLIAPATSILEAMRTTPPTTSLEKITPCPKRKKTAAKGKKMVGSQTSNIWDDVGLALMRAHNAVTAKDFKMLFGVPSNEVVSHHIHKLI